MHKYLLEIDLSTRRRFLLWISNTYENPERSFNRVQQYHDDPIPFPQREFLRSNGTARVALRIGDEAVKKRAQGCVPMQVRCEWPHRALGSFVEQGGGFTGPRKSFLLRRLLGLLGAIAWSGLVLEACMRNEQEIQHTKFHVRK